MYNLDGNLFETIEEASKSSGIAKSTLENHIDDTWKSKNGTVHTLTVENIPLEVSYTGPIYAEHPTLIRLYAPSVSQMADYLGISTEEVLASVDSNKPASNGYTFIKEVK